ncbi:insulinase family protein, partial [Streptococcus pyogenes]
GIAHFLEHKLFETGEGKDILQEFAKLGANANAFTSFSQTSYLMSTSDAVLPALTLLQAFVREAAFTEESVEKEKEIIAQEIEMYLDE